MQNPSVTYAAAGTYTVTLIACNATGASAIVTQTITVTPPPPVVISPVISSLSPNHGAIGDTVTIKGTGFGTVGTMTFNGVNLVCFNLERHGDHLRGTDRDRQGCGDGHLQ